MEVNFRPNCGFFPTSSAGHVTIEVGELSDSQEKDESKKSSGPGQFLLLKETVSLDLKGKEFQPSSWDFFLVYFFLLRLYVFYQHLGVGWVLVSVVFLINTKSKHFSLIILHFRDFVFP